MTDQQIADGLWLCRNIADDPRRAEAAVSLHAKRHYAEALTDLQAARSEIRALRQQAAAQAAVVAAAEAFLAKDDLADCAAEIAALDRALREARKGAE